ncbi:MAG: sigma-70 family RNA polymerase sigma factor [Polyangiales bacterium]
MIDWVTLLTNWRLASTKGAKARATTRLLTEVRRAASASARREFNLARWECDDVAQDVCVKVMAAIAGLRADVAFAAWLREVVRSVVRSAARKERSQRRRVEAMHDRSARCEARPERRFEAREALGRVLLVRESMSPALGAVFDLHLVDGEPIAEAAAALGVARPVVDTRLRRLRIALRDAVPEAA